MQDLAQGVRAQIIKETAPKAAVKRPFTMRTLRRAALWGVGAAGALALAVLSSRNEVAAQRLAEVLNGGMGGSATGAAGALSSPPANPGYDAQAETQRLAQQIRGLANEGEQVKSRLAAVEHDLDDVTGSIGKQIEAVEVAEAARRTEDGPTLTATASAALMTPVSPAPVSFPAVIAPAPAPAPASDSAATSAASGRTAYGIDIGSGLTVQALRARWTVIHSAHPQLFEGLQPVVNIRDVPRANRIELRLVVGPLADAGAAAQLCGSLAPFGLFCQPAMFDGQRLASVERSTPANTIERQNSNDIRN